VALALGVLLVAAVGVIAVRHLRAQMRPRLLSQPVPQQFWMRRVPLWRALLLACEFLP